MRKSERDLAEQLLSALDGPFEPGMLRDEHRERVLELIQAKAEGRRVRKVQAPAPKPTGDLTEALRASLRAAKEAYSLLAATMEESGRAAIARFAMRGKAYAAAIFADKGVLRAETLRFGDEVRTAKDVQLPEPEEVDDKSAARMAARVKELSEPRLDDAELRDDATEDPVAIARRKRKRGEDLVEVAEQAAEAAPEEEQGRARVVDLMELLKERMREGAAARRESPRAKGAAPGSREVKQAAGTRGSRSSALGRSPVQRTSEVAQGATRELTPAPRRHRSCNSYRVPSPEGWAAPRGAGPRTRSTFEGWRFCLVISTTRS